jgi:hypothetical protein
MMSVPIYIHTNSTQELLFFCIHANIVVFCS